MREDLLRRNTAPIGSREWLESLRHGQELDWHNEPPVASQPVTDKLPTTMRQFISDIGQRGRNERCRRFACHNVRAWTRFRRRYGYSPNRVKGAAVMASPEVRQYLRGNASRGGQARARKYSPEQLRVWAAMGGRAKAAKRKQASSPAQSVAGKQERPGWTPAHR